MSDWNKLESTQRLLEIIVDNTTGGGGGGSSTSDITHLGGNAISTDTGTYSNGTMRVTVAQNDPIVDKRNNTFYTYGMLGGNSREIVNSAYIPFAAASNSLPSTDPDSFKPPFDDLHIVAADNTHDASAGDSARSVLLEYYDIGNSFQSLTEDLGDNTTITGVRRIVTFKVVSWGTNKYNYSDILLSDTGDTDLIAIIPGFYNVSPRFQQEIPLNGKIWLDQLEVASMEDTNVDQNVKIRVIARTYDGTDIFDQILFAAGVPYQQVQKYDLSFLPPISGPTAYFTDNTCIQLVGAEEGGASANTKASGHLSYHFA